MRRRAHRARGPRPPPGAEVAAHEHARRLANLREAAELQAERARQEEAARLEAIAREQRRALEERVLPSLGERVRAVSVGCSTGEEAWTLGMVLDRARGKGYRVVGMDRSEVAVESADSGAYPREDARHLPSDLAERYLEPHADAVRVKAALRESVSFTVRDAMVGPPPGHWEIILCKNVLIYFGDEAAERAVQLMLRGLAEGGVLMVAKSEVPRVRALGHRAEELAPGVTVFRS